VDDKIIELALSSKFADFEDAIQYFTAIDKGLTILLTQNTRDYAMTKIAILTAETYLLRL
jgi:predicted nucleic acid-binding protein